MDGQFGDASLQFGGRPGQPTSLQAAGDLDGDGYADLLILLAQRDAQHQPIEARILYGVLSTDNPALLPLPALAPNEPNRNAQQQWLAGDIDGDGRDELLVESWHRESQGPDQWTSRAPQLHLGFSSIAAPSTPL